MNKEKIQTIINEAEYEMLAFDRTSKVVSEKLINTLKQLVLCNVVGQSEQLVCCENCTHFDKKDKTCGEICVNWSAHNKAN